MNKLLIFVGAACAASVVLADGERTLSDDGLTLTFNVAENVVWTNTTPIETTVTTIVKEGLGDACLVPQTNTTFKGEITIKAGYLSGLQASFGKPSKLTVESGGALVFLDLKPGSIGGSSSSPFWNTKFFIEGDGPDHCGAIQRPVTHCDHTINGLCNEMTLTDDAMINCGSRWGFGGTTLDMQNHTLTLSAKKTTWPGSATMHNETFSRIFHFARNGNLLIKNPGAVVVQDRLRLLVESNSRVLDAEGSNGKVADMTVTFKDGTEFRPFTINSTSASNFKTRFEGCSKLTVHNTAYFDGPVDAVGNGLEFAQYQGDYPMLHLRGGVSATNTVVNHYGTSHVTFLGSHTNEVVTLKQNSNGPMTLADDNVFVMSNWWVGVNSLSIPARMIVTNNAQIIHRPDLRRASVMDVGGPNGSYGSYYGILEVSGNAVVSNALAIGNYGRGALYQNGGKVFVMESNGLSTRSNNNAYHGMYGYGYLGMNDGYFAQGYWYNLGGWGDGRGFIVQRGGLMEHWDSADPLRMCFSGDNAYANLAQLGGRSTWKGYATMGFSNYTPTGYGSTCTITVSGTNTLMDMSYNDVGIRMIVSTNAHRKAWTGNVNLNDGGTLHIKRIYMTQMGGADQGTPPWDSLDPAQVRQASKPYINFNGGVLKTAQAGEFFGSSATDHRRELERVTVYEKGAIIDTDGKNVTWRMPLLRPFGHGIKRVTLPAEVTANTATNILIGPTRCYITSASGGICGDVLMDFSNAVRRAVGTIVTCPGCGYEAAPTVQFEKAACDPKTLWTCEVETVDYDAADFQHGGLTKRGEGTLTLTAANTYGGATRLEGGTLAFTDAAGLPANSALEFSAAGLRSGTKTTPLLTAPAYNGGEIRIAEAETLDVETFGKMRTIATFDTPLTTSPAVKLVKSDGTELTGCDWRVAVVGNSIRFGLNKGLAIFLK